MQSHITYVEIYYASILDTLKSQSNEQDLPRVMSGFIRQMTEDKMLVPEENIKLTSIIGQGAYYQYKTDLYKLSYVLLIGDRRVWRGLSCNSH